MRIAGLLSLALGYLAPAPLFAGAQQSPSVRYAVPLSAVSAALDDGSVSVATDLIHLPPSITSAVPEPELRLAAAELRNDDSISLRLVCRRSSECLPFFAVVAMPNRADALLILNRLRKSLDGGPAKTSHTAGVTVGSHVTLELSDRQMRIHLQGIAIDTGEPGHEIRVASLDRRHTYRGIVVDPSTVKGDLP